MTEIDTVENYTDPIAQRTLAISTLLGTAQDLKDADLRKAAVDMAERVRLSIELPRASAAEIAGGKAKRGNEGS